MWKFVFLIAFSKLLTQLILIATIMGSAFLQALSVVLVSSCILELVCGYDGGGNGSAAYISGILLFKTLFSKFFSRTSYIRYKYSSTSTPGQFYEAALGQISDGEYSSVLADIFF